LTDTGPNVPIEDQPILSLNSLPQKHPKRDSYPPLKYTQFVPSDTLVDQLLQLDDEELAISLPDGPLSSNEIIQHVLAADLMLDSFANLTNDKERDPPTVWHAQCLKYWNEWLAAMHQELEALKAKEVYEKVSSLPPGRKAVKSKWVLHIKCEKDGQISRFKGCLVTKGFTQIFGHNFTFTFTPVAWWESIRSILCLAMLNDFELRYVDVKNTFLNAPLEEEIYLVAPKGCGATY